MKIVVTTSARPVGATFVDWTINYLSGANTYYHFQSQQPVAVVDTPLQSTTAHGHQKNHPVGPDEVETLLRQIPDLPQKNSVYTFYPIPHEINHWCKQSGLDIRNLGAADWPRIFKAQTKELQGMMSRCQDAGARIIYIKETGAAASYFITPRVVAKWFYDLDLDAIDDELALYEMLFQHQGKKMRIWDYREMLALDLRPLQPCPFPDYVDLDQPHFPLTTNDLWYDGECAMLEMLRWLEIAPNSERWVRWRPVYYQWQQRQLQHARFTWQMPGIVEAVVKGHYLPLPRLTLPQEAAIQHCLIYAHNLNIETWGLERFPANAQDLHKILETNTHQVDTAYRDVLRTSIDSLRSSM